MKRIGILLLFILLFVKSNAQFNPIGDSAIISLITCAPGKEVYEKFGHTAIRVQDPGQALDVVFNYGIFSFDTPNFYYKFIKGETDYQLGVYETALFLPEYEARNSMVWEQVLNLNPIEKKQLFKLLVQNYQPENRVYRYNFIFDNCATRPRDKIIEALNGYVRFREVEDSYTFRQWIGKYVGTDTWLKFGIDLVFGIEADRTATINESMFLPEVLMNEIQGATVTSHNGLIHNLIKGEKMVLVNANNNPEKENLWLFKPLAIAIILLIIGIIISVWDIRRYRTCKYFDTGLLFLTGIGGIIVFYLMFFSIHPLVKWNYNILWLNPLNLIVAVVLWIKKWRTPLFIYQMINIILLVSALFSFALTKQVFNDAAYPLIVLLLIRTTIWFDITKRKIYRRQNEFK